MLSRVILTLLFLTVHARGQYSEKQARLEDLVRVAVIDNQLRIEWLGTLAPAQRPVSLRGPEGRWEVRAPAALRGVTPGTIYLERPPAGTGDRRHFWYIWISSTPAQLFVTAHRGGQAASAHTVRLSQDIDGSVHLVVVDRVGRKFVQARAGNLIELRTRHARLVRGYLLPLLEQVTGVDPLLPGATDVYRVFDEIEPHGQTEAAIAALLPGLADRDYRMREGASRALAELREPGVCAALRMDQSSLLPEQRARLTRFIEQNSRRIIEDPDAALSDIAFLADCMEFLDDRVRRAAKKRIEELTNQPIPLHRSPTADEWSHAADLVRATMPSP